MRRLYATGAAAPGPLHRNLVMERKEMGKGGRERRGGRERGQERAREGRRGRQFVYFTFPAVNVASNQRGAFSWE